MNQLFLLLSLNCVFLSFGQLTSNSIEVFEDTRSSFRNDSSPDPTPTFFSSATSDSLSNTSSILSRSSVSSSLEDTQTFILSMSAYTSDSKDIRISSKDIVVTITSDTTDRATNIPSLAPTSEDTSVTSTSDTAVPSTSGPALTSEDTSVTSTSDTVVPSTGGPALTSEDTSVTSTSDTAVPSTSGPTLTSEDTSVTNTSDTAVPSTSGPALTSEDTSVTSTSDTAVPSTSGPTLTSEDTSVTSTSDTAVPSTSGPALTSEDTSVTSTSDTTVPSTGGPTLTSEDTSVTSTSDTAELSTGGLASTSEAVSAMNTFNPSDTSTREFPSSMADAPSMSESSQVTNPTPTPPVEGDDGLPASERQLAIALPTSVAGYVLLLILLFLLLAVFRRRRSKDKKVDDYYKDLHETTIFSNVDVDEEEGNERPIVRSTEPRIAYRPKLPAMSHPLTLSELGFLLQNEDNILNEFSTIPMNMVTMDDVPPGAEPKNRYRNVLPNPHTRVPLFLKFGVANSSYINANYIRDMVGSPRAFISTQGPLCETTPDFWRMIWEQRTSVIVMVTELEEGGVVKCHQYWPDDKEGRSAAYENIEVTLTKKIPQQSMVITTFLLRNLEKGVNREVTRFWFRAWPDHGVPDTTEPFLNFIQAVRNASAADIPQGPIAIHCSAGIGRSGVFLATIMGMQAYEDTGEVDVLKVVSTMRQDRGGMVQNKNQYIFIHKALYQYGLWLERARAPTKTFLGDPGSDINGLEGSQEGLLHTD